MKIRQGFVSNSSSSSFTCNVCGTEQSGWMSVDEAGMFECENGHTVCKDHVRKDFDKKKFVNKLIEIVDNLTKLGYVDKEKLKDYLKRINDDKTDVEELIEIYEQCDEEHNYKRIAIFCPMCNLEKISDEDILLYLSKRDKFEINDVEDEMRKKFDTYNDMTLFFK